MKTYRLQIDGSIMHEDPAATSAAVRTLFGEAGATRFEAAADTIAQAVQLAILGASAVYLTFYSHVCVHH